MTTAPKTIAIGADHRGAEASRHLADALRRDGHKVEVHAPEDAGQACDYPEPAYAVATAVRDHNADLGVLICGTAIGMSIAANKVDGVRAAVVHDELTAQLSRQHNDANVLCLSGDLLGQRLIESITRAWLAADFEGGRHARRLQKIERIERGQDPGTASPDA